MEIEYGIPIPTKKRMPKNNWGEIPIGASTFIPDLNYKSATTMVYRFGRRHGMKFTIRKAEKDGVRGLRIWRIS